MPFQQVSSCKLETVMYEPLQAYSYICIFLFIMCACTCTCNTGGKSEAGVLNLPPRPGYGTKGRKISLQTNFFEVKIPPDLSLYHYDVVIEPDVPRAIKRKVMQAAIGKYKATFLGQFPVFDGEKTLYCHKKLLANQVSCKCVHNIQELNIF